MMVQNTQTGQHTKKIFGLAPNVIWMGVVSLFNDLSSEMIFPFIPIFLTSVLGASLTFVGVVEGAADATASILKIASGWISDKLKKRKSFAVFGYSLSALAKPLLAVASRPWHVFGVRFIDRVGKGTRDAPRDALISFSTDAGTFGRAYGFHRAMDTLGASLGPLAAFFVLPLIDHDLRTLFLLSFIASFIAVLVLIFSVREVTAPDLGRETPRARPVVADILPNTLAIEPERARSRITLLGAPFFLFLIAATIASLGKASDAFLILKAREVGTALVMLPIVYVVSNITFAALSTPLGILADRVGKRNTFVAGLLLFAAVYIGFGLTSSSHFIWILFAIYGVYYALTEGVGRAIVASLVPAELRGTAFGMYNAFTGLALLPASVLFGYLGQHFGSRSAFLYGASAALAGAAIFLVFRRFFERKST